MPDFSGFADQSEQVLALKEKLAVSEELVASLKEQLSQADLENTNKADERQTEIAAHAAELGQRDAKISWLLQVMDGSIPNGEVHPNFANLDLAGKLGVTSLNARFSLLETQIAVAQKTTTGLTTDLVTARQKYDELLTEFRRRLQILKTHSEEEGKRLANIEGYYGGRLEQMAARYEAVLNEERSRRLDLETENSLALEQFREIPILAKQIKLECEKKEKEALSREAILREQLDRINERWQQDWSLAADDLLKRLDQQDKDLADARIAIKSWERKFDAWQSLRTEEITGLREENSGLEKQLDLMIKKVRTREDSIFRTFESKKIDIMEKENQRQEDHIDRLAEELHKQNKALETLRKQLAFERRVYDAKTFQLTGANFVIPNEKLAIIAAAREDELRKMSAETYLESGGMVSEYIREHNYFPHGVDGLSAYELLVDDFEGLD